MANVKWLLEYKMLPGKKGDGGSSFDRAVHTFSAQLRDISLISQDWCVFQHGELENLAAWEKLGLIIHVSKLRHQKPL